MSAIYDQHDKAFRTVSAFAILSPAGEPVAKVAIKYPAEGNVPDPYRGTARTRRPPPGWQRQPPCRGMSPTRQRGRTRHVPTTTV